MKHKVLDQDYKTIIDITDKTKEKHYIKKKTHLHSKFNSLKSATSTKKIVNEAVINLTGKELDETTIQLLNLGPKFVPTYNKQRRYMDVIQTTEFCALELENDEYFEKAERLRQGVSKILSKDVNKKHRNNLTIGQINAIREIKNSTNLNVYPFDKGSGFVIMEEEDAIKRIEEQIRKLIIIDYDPTTTLLNMFQKELAKLRKEGKFHNKTYYEVYQSDAIPSRLYGFVKAHKP